MCIRNRRLLLLSSSALMLWFAGVASSQTPAPDTPPTTTTPETPPAEAPAPQPAQPETPPTGTGPTVTVPQVTVEAPKPRPARRAARAAPARTATRPPPAPTPTSTPPSAPPTTTAGQLGAASPFRPPPSLNTITGNQIEASQAQSFGNLFFTMPGATSAGLAPGASRPVLRGLDDFRVRVQENGIGSLRPGPRRADRSAVASESRDLSRPGGTALRLTSRRRRGGSHQQPHSVRRAARRMANANPKRYDHGRPGARRRRPVRRRLPLLPLTPPRLHPPRP